MKVLTIFLFVLAAWLQRVADAGPTFEVMTNLDVEKVCHTRQLENPIPKISQCDSLMGAGVNLVEVKLSLQPNREILL